MRELKNNTLATFPQIKITKTPGKAQTGIEWFEAVMEYPQKKMMDVLGYPGMTPSEALNQRAITNEHGWEKEAKKNYPKMYNALGVVEDIFVDPLSLLYPAKAIKTIKGVSKLSNLQKLKNIIIGADSIGDAKTIIENKKQEGGMSEQQQPDLMSLFSWFAENVSDDDFNSPEDVAKEFQQLSPEQQQQFVASIQQQMVSMQYGGMSINASPTKKYQEGGMDEMSILGYSDDSPYRDYEMLPIDSNYLTMENTGIPLMAVGNQSGERQFMSPYSGDYYFPNDEDVTEYPLAQTGKDYMNENWNYTSETPVQYYKNSYMNMIENIPQQITKSSINFKLPTINLENRLKKKQEEVSKLDPKIFKRDKNGNIIENDWDKVIDLSKSNPFEYAPMLQNYANALNQDPQYRATANIKGAFTPELDVRGAIQAIDDELKDSMRNVDMNNTAGAAIAAQLQANASKNKLNVINDAAQKNAQIRGQNSQSEANRQNQQTQLQQQYDAQYYDNILRSRSASQQEKNRALNALLSRKEQKDAIETNLAVATMPYNNFKYKPGEGVFRNNKVEFQAPQVEPRKIEEETTKKKKQMGG